MTTSSARIISSTVAALMLAFSAVAQESAGLPPQEVLIGQRFEVGVIQDSSARDYMLRFSDPQFFTYTSKLRKVWGRAIVLSGDTLKLSNELIHLHGIQAPDISRVCSRKDINIQFDAGGHSLGALKTWAAQNKAVVCYVRDGKPLEGTCFIWGFPGPMNIARLLVRSGAAWAYPPDNSPYLRDEGWAEGVASAAKDPIERNLWHTDCEPPTKSGPTSAK